MGSTVTKIVNDKDVTVKVEYNPKNVQEFTLFTVEHCCII